MFCPNTGTKFYEPCHLNHVISRLDNIRYLSNCACEKVTCISDDFRSDLGRGLANTDVDRDNNVSFS